MIHPVQVGGENGRFASPRSGSDFNDRVAVCIFVRRRQRDLNFAFNIGHQLFEVWNLVVGDRRDLNVA